MFQKLKIVEKGASYIQENTVFTTANLFRDFKTIHEEQMYYWNIQERTQLMLMTDSS